MRAGRGGEGSLRPEVDTGIKGRTVHKFGKRTGGRNRWSRMRIFPPAGEARYGPAGRSEGGCRPGWPGSAPPEWQPNLRTPPQWTLSRLKGGGIKPGRGMKGTGRNGAGRCALARSGGVRLDGPRCFPACFENVFRIRIAAFSCSQIVSWARRGRRRRCRSFTQTCSGLRSRHAPRQGVTATASQACTWLPHPLPLSTNGVVHQLHNELIVR